MLAAVLGALLMTAMPIVAYLGGAYLMRRRGLGRMYRMAAGNAAVTIAFSAYGLAAWHEQAYLLVLVFWFFAVLFARVAFRAWQDRNLAT